MSTLSFRYSSTPGAPPVLIGVDSDFAEFSCHVSKPEEPKKVTPRRIVEIMEYRKRKREVLYEQYEDDSTEYTYDD